MCILAMLSTVEIVIAALFTFAVIGPWITPLYRKFTNTYPMICDMAFFYGMILFLLTFVRMNFFAQS